MRRGRPGLGGWRNENPKHFGPRGSGTPHFRPSRSYGMPDGSRFPPPGLRNHRPLYFSARTNQSERRLSEYNDRNQYQSKNQYNQGHQNRGHYRDQSGMRYLQPYSQHLRPKDNDSFHSGSSNYYGDAQDFQPTLGHSSANEVNKHTNHAQHKYQKQQFSHTWSIPLPENKKHYYEDRSPNKMYRYQESVEPSKISLLDYPGHRPPSSDYYAGNPSPVVNNNTSFSRSVDDTVDIVRKRLLNRNESHTVTEDSIHDQNNSDHASESRNIYHKNQTEPTIKKKMQRQKQTVNANCNKIKNKIVHQLFKMDKDKIHKLMDNPNSSTKFEYAINSLITESQISLNRHLRSVAEKSLCSSSTDFIQNDNNTIYEDTFMKQMQCILDPQDTILLEDMKPLVMAELSKFLQIENYDTPIHQPKEEHGDYQFDLSNSDDYSLKTYNEDQTAELLYDSIENCSNIDYNDAYQNLYKEDMKLLYERRSTKYSADYNEERRQSSESRRKSLENKSMEDSFKTSPLPLFNSGTEQILEEDDPFAELDKQYHVPVDHNFIQTEVYASPQQSTSSTKSNNIQHETFSTPSSSSQILRSHTINITNDLQMHNTDSPVTFHLDNNCETNEDTIKNLEDETTCKTYISSLEKSMTPTKGEQTNLNKKSVYINKSKDIDNKQIDKNENGDNSTKSCTQLNTRKRSMDQRPSHRKEKRKKSETEIPQFNQESINTNNVEIPCNSKNEEKGNDNKKSTISLYFPMSVEKKDITKERKKVDTSKKSYSEKYVKRKEIIKKKETEPSKKRNSNSLSISVPSPKNNNKSGSALTPSKTEIKTPLKSIDMFVEQPKKVHIHHQAHRNTALPSTHNKSTETHNKVQVSTVNDNKKPNKKPVSKETQTANCKNYISKFSQTERKKFVVKAVQTDPVCFERIESNYTNNSVDAFDRMKQIDLEIQVLLQEKFKLYSSLENKGSCENSMQTLGMTVVNVTPLEETDTLVEAEALEDKDQNETQDTLEISADVIADEFTKIPLDELEQIAVESMDYVSTKRPRRMIKKIAQYEQASSSPSMKHSVKKTKPPNISLIEQIITDDRPLEDIIVLDEFENSPVKKKTLPKKKISKKCKKSKPKINKHQQSFNLKECTVVLERFNVDKHLTNTYYIYEDVNVLPSPVAINDNQTENFSQSKDIAEDKQESTDLIDDNDLEFDMLDVSEDIVIGDDNFEIKSQIKDINDIVHQPITDDIILDNNQSSCDDLVTADSNQEENECKMYDYATDENLRRDSITVTGNADSVLAIECFENNFIAACLDGNVYHFNCDGQLLNTLKGSNLAVTCLTIVKEKYGTTVYTGSLDSRIRYYDLETGLEKGPECNVLSPIQTMDRAWDTVFVGTRTGFVLQFECKNNILIPVSTVKFSEQSILALRAMKEGSRKVLLVAARSENVTIKDAQTGLLLRTLYGPNMTVYTLLFEDGKVYCGTSSHQIHVFEYTSGSHVGTHEGGKGAVCLRATGGLVFAGCYDGCVYVYREGETRPLAQLRGPSNMLLSLAVVGSKIIAGYKDRSLYIWKIPLSILQEMIL